MVMQNADPVQCRTAVGQILHGIISVCFHGIIQ